MTMMTKITLALAVVFAVATAIPASAAPRTCGYTDFQYDSSGATVGPYCDGGAPSIRRVDGAAVEDISPFARHLRHRRLWKSSWASLHKAGGQSDRVIEAPASLA